MKAKIVTASILSGLIFIQSCASSTRLRPSESIAPNPEFVQEMKPGDIVDWHQYEKYERDPVTAMGEKGNWWWSRNGKVDGVGEVLLLVGLVILFAGAIAYSRGYIKSEPYGSSKRNSATRRAFHKRNPCPSTGKRSGACPGYHVDHIVPLSCGGSDSTSNMQWLTASANLSKGGCR